MLYMCVVRMLLIALQLTRQHIPPRRQHHLPKEIVSVLRATMMMALVVVALKRLVSWWAQATSLQIKTIPEPSVTLVTLPPRHHQARAMRVLLDMVARVPPVEQAQLVVKAVPRASRASTRALLPPRRPV